MKKIMFVFFVFICAAANAQTDSNYTQAITVHNYSSFPSFQLLKTDSTWFSTRSVLDKKKPTILMYFSPTCSHCQHQAEELTGNMGLLKRVKILMVSAYALPDIKKFSSDYAIDKFPNITLAQDVSNNLLRFLDIQSLPGIYVYNKKAKLVQQFSTNVKAEELATALKK